MDKRIAILLAFVLCSTFIFGQSNSIEPRQLKFAPDERMILFSRDTTIGGVANNGRYFHWAADSVFQDRALDQAYLQNDTLYLVVVNSITGVEDTFSTYLPYLDSTEITATMPITWNPLTGNISTSVNEGKLIGRFSVGGAGVMQEIDPAFGLTLKTNGDLEVDTSEIATQYDLTQLDLQGVTDNGNITTNNISVQGSDGSSTISEGSFSLNWSSGVGVTASAEDQLIGVNTDNTASFLTLPAGAGTRFLTTRDGGFETNFIADYAIPANIEITFPSITGTLALLGDDISEFTNDAGYITANQSITLSGDVTGTGTTAITTTIANNAVTNEKFRQGAGLSVVGVTGNSTANVADITAGTDGHVLRRSGATLGFGLVPLSSVSATSGQVVYGASSILAQSSLFTYNGTAATITAPLTQSTVFTVTGSSSGTANGPLRLVSDHIFGTGITLASSGNGGQDYSFGSGGSGFFNNGFYIYKSNAPAAYVLHITDTGNTGIGSLTGAAQKAKSKLDVQGGVAIGSTYYGTNAAPTNGLLVEGQSAFGATSAVASAKVEIVSNTQGFLPPRMTEAQKNAIASPAEGLMIYQTDATKGWYGFDGTNWVILN